jgi:transcriptional regulator with PAS, ATPase and Fis domain
MTRRKGRTPEARSAQLVGQDELQRGWRYRRVMHELLRRDYLTRADWSFALHDLARMARQALQAREALVALHDPATGRWSARTSGGRLLADEQISSRASRSVLELVRQTGKPALRTSAVVLELDSESLDRHQVHGILCIPLHWWDVTERKPRPSLGGCLYVDRTALDPPFAEEDVELLEDIAEVAQRTLNALRRLQHVQSDLERTREQLRESRRAESERYRLGRYTTCDPAFADHVLRPLRRAAAADRVCLLLLGPTGSGKSHLAHAYHHESPRRDGPFVVLDCSQVTSEQTLAAELFGYAPRSGFANAPERGRRGAAARAHGGTLFIDEIAALPPALQQRLLTLIQTGSHSPLGTSERQQVDLQVIAATNEDLDQLVREGAFREDLYWRISELTIDLPPLNERTADIPALAEAFLESARQRFSKHNPRGFTSQALGALLHHDWSAAGNIRGLEHTVHRSVLLAAPEAELLDAGDLQFQRMQQPESSRRRLPLVRARSTARRSDPATPLAAQQLAALLERKIREHAGRASTIAADPEVAHAFGYSGNSMPCSTLCLKIRRLGLSAVVEAERRQQRRALGHEAPEMDLIVSAIRQHRSGAAAARSLGISRDVLGWRLRSAGLSVRGILAGGPEPQK